MLSLVGQIVKWQCAFVNKEISHCSNWLFSCPKIAFSNRQWIVLCLQSPTDLCLFEICIFFSSPSLQCSYNNFIYSPVYAHVSLKSLFSSSSPPTRPLSCAYQWGGRRPSPAHSTASRFILCNKSATAGEPGNACKLCVCNLVTSQA